MGRHWADIPPALPPEVVADIWREINAGPTPPTTLPAQLKAFVEIAIDHPHYASAAEIAKALDETYNRVNPVVHQIKHDARTARLTSST
tara:strand:+ start:200 stop:466 length:267 start_codon:yes stop_codon:yes gene_type:complete